jgi:hypothetical protein
LRLAVKKLGQMGIFANKPEKFFFLKFLTNKKPFKPLPDGRF